MHVYDEYDMLECDVSTIFIYKQMNYLCNLSGGPTSRCGGLLEVGEDRHPEQLGAAV